MIKPFRMKHSTMRLKCLELQIISTLSTINGGRSPWAPDAGSYEIRYGGCHADHRLPGWRDTAEIRETLSKKLQAAVPAHNINVKSCYINDRRAANGQFYKEASGALELHKADAIYPLIEASRTSCKSYARAPFFTSPNPDPTRAAPRIGSHQLANQKTLHHVGPELSADIYPNDYDTIILTNVKPPQDLKRSPL